MSTKITARIEIEKPPNLRMGVASPSTKRRLEPPSEGDQVVASKVPRKCSDLVTNNNNPLPADPYCSAAVQDSTGNENSSDFLTTSILARTLLSSTSSPSIYLTSDPLESLKSSLEALPAPAALDEEIRPLFLSPTKTTIHSDLAYLCHPDRAPSTLTVLSPIDERSTGSVSSRSEWVKSPSPMLTHQQLITEDENGKSYFNLGSAEPTIVARKSSPENNPWSHCNGANGGGGLGNLNGAHCGTGGSNSTNDFDDNASSSSCESISSEDLFHSGEEFDASDDEDDEICSYKQQRSTVLHLSLCKLNKFRSQQCVEPSLHRSVLICNTLRHIEQEIKSEDEIDESLKSREKLPSFWRSSGGGNHCFSNHSPHNNSNPNNPSSSSLNHSSQPQITDIRPSTSLLSPHDPYLSPNPYSSSNGANDSSPYLSYDYSSLRPTPYHTTSYDYDHELPTPLNNGGGSGPGQQPLLSEVTSAANNTLLECDSGYGGEDLDLSSYYYNTPPRSMVDTRSSLMTSERTLLEQSLLDRPLVDPSLGVVADPDFGTVSSSPGASEYLHCGGFGPTMTLSVDPGSLSPPSDPDSPESSICNGEHSPPRSLTSPPTPPVDSFTTKNNNSTALPPSGSNCSEPNSGPSLAPGCDYLVGPARSQVVDGGGGPPDSQSCWSAINNGVGGPVPPSGSPKSSTVLKEPLSPPTTSSSQMPISAGAVSIEQPHPNQSSQPLPPSANNTYQDSQCGMESRRSDLSRSVGNHFNNHNLPMMENLISSPYSAASL